MANKRFINSDELKTLLQAKRDNVITSEQNERLGYIALHLANIILKTPKIRRFLLVSDPDGELASQMRAQAAIVVLGVCPYTYDETAGKAYSYCLYCVHSEVCDVIRRLGKRKQFNAVLETAFAIYRERTEPAKKKW